MTLVLLCAVMGLADVRTLKRSKGVAAGGVASLRGGCQGRRFAARCARSCRTAVDSPLRFADGAGEGSLARPVRSALGGGPELGGAPVGEDAAAGDLAVVGERGERPVELGGGGVAVQQVT